MGVWRVDKFAFLEKIEKLCDFKSNILADAVGRQLSLREVLEDGAQGTIVLLKHGFCHFALFL